MIRSLVAVISLAAAAVGFASPASADEATYLRLREQYPFLTEQQLLAEGRRICYSSNSGVGSADIVSMVQKDLDHVGVSVSAASNIVPTAIVQLGC